MKKIMECSQAIAEAVKLCKPLVIPMYPITPQTHIVEKIADFINDGELDSKSILVESEHSAMSACVGASAAGVRTFTASSSQGLILMSEVMFAAAGLRLPIVMAVANRALSAPINIWCFTKNAKVLMSDFTYKHIDKVKNGESVLGKDKKGNLVFTEVKKTFGRYTDDLIKLKTDKFDIFCTSDHEFYERNGHRHWTKAMNLKGKKLHWVGCDFEINDEFKRGWLAGIADGDGCFYLQGKSYNYRLKVKDEELVDYSVKWANEFGFKLRKVDYLKKYGYFIAITTLTEEVKRFRMFIEKNGGLDYCRGYLTGMYDAEGTGPFKIKQAVIYNSSLEIVNKVEECLKKLGISFKRYADTRRGIHYHNDNYHIKINNVPEFFIRCRPILERKRKNILRMTLKSIKSRLKILDIINLNERKKVYNLETGTNNYFVNGLLVHNCDHSDAMAVRDSGWIQLFCESSQEAYDTTIQAFKIAEKDSIPVVVNIDGFILSHVWEPVDSIPNLGGFLPEYKPRYKLDTEKPVTMGAIAFPNSYMEIKEEQHRAMLDSLKTIKDINEEFNKKFNRKYGDGLVESYKISDADNVIVAMGSVCGTVRIVVDELRKKGEKVGLLKIKAFRPFPKEEILKNLKNIKDVKVFDRAISFGNDGPLYIEIKDCLQGCSNNIQNFIVGLGGRDITKEHIKKTFSSKKGGWLK